MKIKIISDSTCDLPAELIEKYDIAIMPLTVIMDGKPYADGLSITPQVIFDHVAAGGELCTTSAVNYGDYLTIFQHYADQYDGVFCINIGSGFSSCHQNATLAAAEFQNVRAVDSMSLSTGQGRLVLKAVELAETATDLDQMKEELEEFAKHIEISFLLNRLEYMVKGGRCSSATALGANLLQLRPCIEVKDGKMTVVKKYRGSYDKCLGNYIKDRLDGREDINRDMIFLTYTTISQKCYDTVTAGIEAYGHFEKNYETIAGCTISCHCGPDTLGIIFTRK